MNNFLKTLLTPTLGLINPFNLLKKKTTTPVVPTSMTGTGQIGPVKAPTSMTGTGQIGPVTIPNTSANKVVNPKTGGLTTTPPPTNTSPTIPTWDTPTTTTPPPTTIQTPAPTTVTTPTAPDVSSLRTGVANAEKAYTTSMQMTPEEEAAQAEIDRLQTSFRTGYQGIEDQTIPMEFITGQQTSLEKRALNLAEPLSAKLARLQAKRTSATEASKFALERADKAVEAAKGTTSEGFTLGEGQTRYDAFGNIIAGGTQSSPTTYTEGTDPTADAYVKGVLSGQYKLENIPENYRGLVAQGTAGQKIQTETSPYSAERAFRTIQSVNELLPQVNNMTTGFGSLLSVIPESQAKYFKSQINTLKSSIITNELTAMREASKTGGALGNVSDRESEFLSNALGALDTAVKPEQFKAQLEKIKQSVERWQQAVNQYGGTQTASANTTGGVVKTTIGDINTNW